MVIAYTTRDQSLGPSSVHIDDAWVLLGWKAHRWVDIQRAGSTSLGFVLLLRAWLGVFGFTYRHAQWLPLIVSLLSAPAFLLLALRLRIRYPAALLGGAMLLASPNLVTYATRVKQYSLEVLLAILVIGLAAAALREPTAARAWILLSIGSVVSLAISFALLGVVVAGFGAATVAFCRQEGLTQLRRSAALSCTTVVTVFIGVWYLLIIRPSLSPALHDFWSGFYLSNERGAPNTPPFWHWIDESHHGMLGHDWTLVQFLFKGAFSGPTIVLIVAFVLASVLVAMRRRLHALLFGVPILASIAASAAQLTPLGGGRTDIWLYAPMAFMIASGVDIVLEWVQDSHRRDGPGKRRRSTILRGRDVLFGGSVGLIALVCMFNIPSPSAFPWPDVVPLITELEAGRAPNDLVVVAGPFTFNYALHAPQPFVTRVSNRNATHFTPVVQGVNAMNWQDYSAPVTELRSRVRNVRDVWVIDAPNIAYPFGSAPRNELRHEGFQLVSESRSDGGVLEHWHRQA